MLIKDNRGSLTVYAPSGVSRGAGFLSPGSAQLAKTPWPRATASRPSDKSGADAARVSSRAQSIPTNCFLAISVWAASRGISATPISLFDQALNCFQRRHLQRNVQRGPLLLKGADHFFAIRRRHIVRNKSLGAEFPHRNNLLRRQCDGSARLPVPARRSATAET